MTGEAIRTARRKSGKTQGELAKLLGVSQAYVSQMEGSRRRIPEKLVRRLARRLKLPATALPVSPSIDRPLEHKDVADELARLVYPGLAYLQQGEPTRNPLEVFMAALSIDDLDARLREALPWILLSFPDLDSDRLVRFAKLHDLQNRLGFLVGLAREAAEIDSRFAHRLEALGALERSLEKSRLVREDRFGQQRLSNAMRDWLREHRSALAEHWNVLSDLRREHLPYVHRNP